MVFFIIIDSHANGKENLEYFLGYKNIYLKLIYSYGRKAFFSIAQLGY